jgi:hypothetical protein
MKRIALVLIFVLFMCFPLFGQGIDSVLFGLILGGGYTAIDLPSALGWEEQYFEEWEQIYATVNLQGSFLNFGSFTLGAEIGYNLLYYYYVRVPYVPSPLIYEGTVSTINIGALGTMSLTETLAVQAVVGLHIFEDGVTLGVKSSLLYRIPISELMAVPLGLTAEVIFGDGTPIVIGLVAGIEYDLRL